jgi:hypothetical protein
MKTAETRDIKLFDAATDKVLWKRTSVSLVDGNTAYLPLFWICPQTDMMMCWLDQQASSIYRSLDFRFTRETMRNTPPQVDISLYGNTSRKKCRIEEEIPWRQRASASLLCFLRFCDALARRGGVKLAQVFITENSKAGDTYSGPIVRQSPLFARSSSRNLARFPEFPCFRKRSIPGEGYASCQHFLRIVDVQMYVCSVGMLGETSDHWGSMNQRFLSMSSRSISERDQKQDGDQPAPEKPGKSKTEKPGREIDKGEQRVKRPKKRIGMPPPPDKRGLSGLVLTLRGLCWPLFFLFQDL